MYPLLPWKLLTGLLSVIVAAAVYADDIGKLFGVPVQDSAVIKYLPLILIAAIGAIFGPTARWAPWRLAWKVFPILNKLAFPDINGVWIGKTKSNWSKIERMVEASRSDRSISPAELGAIPLQEDVLAVEMVASLFTLKIRAALSSTESQSFSISAKPRKNPQSGQVHINYIYLQEVPNAALSDQDNHMGAADVVIDQDDTRKAEGVYWTRRMWTAGLNTAGLIELSKRHDVRDHKKTLKQYAAEARTKITGQRN